MNIISSYHKNQFPITLYKSKPIVSVPSKLNSKIIEVQILDHLESGVISTIFPCVEDQRILLLKCPMVRSPNHKP